MLSSPSNDLLSLLLFSEGKALKNECDLCIMKNSNLPLILKHETILQQWNSHWI